MSAQLPLVFPAAETLHFVDARELREAAPADALRGLREGGVARRRPRLPRRQKSRQGTQGASAGMTRPTQAAAVVAAAVAAAAARHAWRTA